MMTPDERYSLCNGYLEDIEELRSNLEDDLRYTAARHGEPSDKDNPFYQELFDRIDNLCDFIENHSKELYAEYSAYEDEQNNLYDNFNAWYHGLCPKAIKHLFTLELEEIAKFKTQVERSFEDTQHAVERWKAIKEYRKVV